MTTTSSNITVGDWMKSAHFIDGCYNLEDMIQIPGTRWIVGSGLTTLGYGMADQVITKIYLHLFDADYAVFKQSAQDGTIEVQGVDEDNPKRKVKGQL